MIAANTVMVILMTLAIVTQQRSRKEDENMNTKELKDNMKNLVTELVNIVETAYLNGIVDGKVGVGVEPVEAKPITAEDIKPGAVFEVFNNFEEEIMSEHLAAAENELKGKTNED
jgi:hypothetical protein